MRFILKIKNDGNEIVLDDEKDLTFTSFTYKSNSIDDKIREKNSVDARNEFTFHGTITTSNYATLKKVAEWAKKTTRVYAEIDITVIDEGYNQNAEMRRYHFDEVFCIDYEEVFDNNAGNSFTLFMAQKKIGTLNDITCSDGTGDEDE